MLVPRSRPSGARQPYRAPLTPIPGDSSSSSTSSSSAPMTPRSQADTEADERAWYDDEESAVVDESAGGDGKFLGDSAKYASKVRAREREKLLRYKSRDLGRGMMCHAC
jgi:hypothetical protein